jgi:hypothetical protein
MRRRSVGKKRLDYGQGAAEASFGLPPSPSVFCTPP